MSTSRMMFSAKTAGRNRWTTVLICLALMILTVVPFASVKDNGFINLDDNRYIYENPHVQSGLNMDSIKYAFSFDVSNWHPLTWLSLMADHHFFGVNPAGYHVVNLIFHVINTILLFLVLWRMTRAVWPCAFVAAVFAIHPLHVESVAWVAERKDVLSGLFWILTMGAYSYYVEKPELRRYVFVLLFFILGLMSKPMLVTLPFVLLLLDYWPLRRFETRIWLTIRLAMIEKIPLFVLTILSCILTYMAQAQGGAVQTAKAASPFVQMGNVLISYIAYIGKMIWPASLAVLYPYPASVAGWQVLGSALLLIAITAFVLWRARKSPYLATGWLWYLGSLVPVIGIVQVGCQAMADRYTYIPLIGLFMMAAWGASELAKKLNLPGVILPVLSAGIILCLSVLTWMQVGYWQNNLTLYDHTLKVTENNWLIHNNRGNVHTGTGNFRQAIEDYTRSIEIKPDYAEAYINRGAAYNGLEHYNHAVADFSRAIQIKPDYAEAYINRGAAYNNLGKHRLAIEDLDKGIAIRPGYAEAYFSRGVAHNARHKYSQAIEDFSRTIDIKPSYAIAYIQRGLIYFNQGDVAAGCRDAQKVCALGNCELLDVVRGNGYCR